jgi:hypothetical protein
LLLFYLSPKLRLYTTNNSGEIWYNICLRPAFNSIPLLIIHYYLDLHSSLLYHYKNNSTQLLSPWDDEIHTLSLLKDTDNLAGNTPRLVANTNNFKKRGALTGHQASFSPS